MAKNYLGIDEFKIKKRKWSETGFYFTLEVNGSKIFEIIMRTFSDKESIIFLWKDVKFVYYYDKKIEIIERNKAPRCVHWMNFLATSVAFRCKMSLCAQDAYVKRQFRLPFRVFHWTLWIGVLRYVMHWLA